MLPPKPDKEMKDTTEIRQIEESDTTDPSPSPIHRTDED